jgi:hypothetical protein
VSDFTPRQVTLQDIFYEARVEFLLPNVALEHRSDDCKVIAEACQMRMGARDLGSEPALSAADVRKRLEFAPRQLRRRARSGG